MILNRQRRVRIPVQALDAFLAKACKALRVSSAAVTICLVTNKEMARWNRLYRGKSRPTDVLSFPMQSKRSGATEAKKRRPPSRSNPDRDAQTAKGGPSTSLRTSRYEG